MFSSDGVSCLRNAENGSRAVLVGVVHGQGQSVEVRAASRFSSQAASWWHQLVVQLRSSFVRVSFGGFWVRSPRNKEPAARFWFAHPSEIQCFCLASARQLLEHMTQR